MKLTADWICGFVETSSGESTFVISITKKKSSNSEQKKKAEEQVRLFFKITQHYRNVQVLYALKHFFGVGVVKRQTKNPEIFWEYVVSRFEHLTTRIIPFFESNKLHTAKQFEFLKFRKAAIIMARKEHLTLEGLAKIKLIALRMNKYVSEIELPPTTATIWDEDKVRTSSREEEETEE